MRRLIAYFSAATLARSADAGAIVAVVLLAAASPATSGLVGLFGAALTAPHLAGPFLAPVLDRTRRPRIMLAGAFLLYGVSLATAAVLIVGGFVVPSVVALVIAGACGPLLTGGLSSQLGQLVAPTARAQRRAQGADALTYGVAATIGPVVVALVARSSSAVWASIALAGSAAVAAIVVLLIARRSATSDDRGEPAPEAVPFWRALATVFTVGPLRRVTLVVCLTAAAVGAVPLLGLASGIRAGAGASEVALLVALFGAGNLVGAVAVTIRPLRTAPEPTVGWTALVSACCLVLIALPLPSVVNALAFGLVGAVSAIQFASSLTARSDFAPEGTRAQVFVTVGGLKVAFSSLGVAVAGVAAVRAPDALLLIAPLLPAVAFAAMLADRAAAMFVQRRRGRASQQGHGPGATGSAE